MQGGPAQQVRIPDHADPGPEPADPPDGRAFWLSRQDAAAGAHRQYRAGSSETRSMAQSERKRAARPVAAAHGLVAVNPSPPAGIERESPSGYNSRLLVTFS